MPSATMTQRSRKARRTTPSSPATAMILPSIVDKEAKEFSNFLLLTFAILFIFAFMIKTTPLPPPHRVMGVMLDAGSTGTRAQLFTFRHHSPTGALRLESTAFFTLDSSVASLASGVATDKRGAGRAFLKPLLDKVKKAVPGVRRRQRTPISLRATAGLRLVGEEVAEVILAELRTVLRESEFLFEDEWVGILDGAAEATHAWTTLNYLEGNLDGEREKEGAGKKDYVGALELGGASMQVVYRDDQREEGADQGVAAARAPAATKTSVSVFDKSHLLRTSSYFGLGLLDFTKKLYHLFESEGVLEEGNPCFRKDKLFEDKLLHFGVPGSEETRVVNMTGDGDFERCVASTEITIATHSNFLSPGSALPPGMRFYAYAFFYDRVVGMGLSSTPSKDELAEKGRELCEAHPARFVKGDFDEACAEFSYVYALLKVFTKNFTLPHGSVRFRQYIDGHVLGWALGAVLEIIEPSMHQQLSLDSESVFLS